MDLRNWLVKLAILLALSSLAVADGGDTGAAELIAKARQYDCNYCSLEKADRDKAVAMYRRALAADPDKRQKLHILFRLAQLNGTNYLRSKGEKPQYAEAIRYYKQIISEFAPDASPENPPDEPTVYKALLTIGDHYVTLWRFDEAGRWYNQVLSYDLGVLLARWRTMRESSEQASQAPALARAIKKIALYQKVAVGQIAYATSRVAAGAAYAEMAKLSHHPHRHIARAATEMLARTQSDLWELPAELGKPFVEAKVDQLTESRAPPEAEVEKHVAPAAHPKGHQDPPPEPHGTVGSLGAGLIAVGGFMILVVLISMVWQATVRKRDVRKGRSCVL